MKSPTKLIVVAFLLVFAVVNGTVLYWLYGSDKVLNVKNGPVPIRPTTQDSDDLVFMIVNYCKLQGVDGVIRRSLVSTSVRVILPLQSDTSPKTCTQADVPLLIPKGVVPDTYYVNVQIEYQINPIKKVIETFDSQAFTIR